MPRPESTAMTIFDRYRPLIDDWEAFQAAVKRPLPTTIWANPSRTSPETLLKLLPAEVQAIPLPWLPGASRLPADFRSGLHWTYLAGLYHVQEEVSLLPAYLLDAQPGERVLDLCAAPGNKTAQISLAMRNTGTLIANDRNPGRMRAARQALDRLGCINVTTTTYDGGNFSRRAGNFDKVLVDAPCSCEGTCRKDASILQSNPNSFMKLIGTQKALLRKAVQLCRPGGRIVYATCTFAPEENELVVDAMLQEFGPDVVTIRPVTMPNFTFSPGLVNWQEQRLDDSLRHALRVWPHQNDTGGFFVAVLGKKARAPAPEHPQPWNTNEERSPWLPFIEDYFGIDSQEFTPYQFIKWSRKRLYMVNRQHLPVLQPEPDAVGMFFMHIDGKYPKLTTAAAQYFGKKATRHVVDLLPEQAAAYLARRDTPIASEQVLQGVGTGYVIVRYQGLPLGVGVYRARQGLLESLFPKGWARSEVTM